MFKFIFKVIEIFFLNKIFNPNQSTVENVNSNLNIKIKLNLKLIQN